MRILIADDFSLDKIAASGQCFRALPLGGGAFRFITGGHLLYIRPAGPDLSNAPGTFEASCTEEEWAAVWAPYFDLGRDYAAIRRAVPESDAWMHRAAVEGQGLRILRQDPWETLITFILSQRKSIPAIKASVELLCAACGRPLTGGSTGGAGQPVYAFPTPQALAGLSDTALAACKPGYRAPYLRAAAVRVISGEVDLAALARLDDSALLAALKGLYGVGEKVARCTALFGYGRLGLAPVDTWIEKVITRAYGGRDPFPGYGAAAGVVQQYAFFWALNHKAQLS